MAAPRQYTTRRSAILEALVVELKKIFNSRFSTSESARANYARGEDTYDPILSQAVVFPETNVGALKLPVGPNMD